MNCPYCHKEAEWVSNEAVYGRRYGKSYMIYLCRDCDAYVGCHNNTRKPLGTMANKTLRGERKKTHGIVDPLWKTGKYSRGGVYALLAEHFGREIHIGESSIEQCCEIREAVSVITTPPHAEEE